MSLVAIQETPELKTFLRTVGIRPAIRLDVSDAVDELLCWQAPETRPIAILALCGLSRAQIGVIVDMKPWEVEKSLADMAGRAPDFKKYRQSRKEMVETWRANVVKTIEEVYPRLNSLALTGRELEKRGLYSAAGLWWSAGTLAAFMQRYCPHIEKSDEILMAEIRKGLARKEPHQVIVDRLNKKGIRSLNGKQITMPGIKAIIYRMRKGERQGAA